jgi:amino acid adenylation domain-containing protein
MRSAITRNRQTLRQLVRREVATILSAAPSEVPEATTLAGLGIDSLEACALSNRFLELLGAEVHPSELLPATSRTVADLLGRRVPHGRPRPAGRAPSARWCASYAASYAQRSIWLALASTPSSPSYNLSVQFRVLGSFIAAHLAHACTDLVGRHPVLRTTYATSRSDLRCTIRGCPSSAPFREVDAATWTKRTLDIALARERERPFRLDRDILFRVAVFRIADRMHVVSITSHHLACDLWSLETLLDELGDLYARRSDVRGPTGWVPPPQYREHARRLRSLIGSPGGERLWRYWRGRLRGPVAPLAFPSNDPSWQAQPASPRRFRLNATITARIERLARDHNVTEAAALLAVYIVALSCCSGQPRLRVGVPTHGRGSRAYRNTVGNFVNPVVIDAELSPESSFSELLKHTAGRLNDALRHALYPVGLLTERLRLGRDVSEHPLFQATFAVHRAHLFEQDQVAAALVGHGGAHFALGALRCRSLPTPVTNGQFDLSLSLARDRHHYHGTLGYDSCRLTKAIAARVLHAFTKTVRLVCGNPRLLIGDLLTVSRPPAAIAESASPAVARDIDLVTVIRAQCARAPSAIAVVDESGTHSYAALQDRAHEVAAWLSLSGVRVDDTVAISLPMGFELIATALGAWIAGAAFLLLDASQPAGYLQELLRDVQPSVLIGEVPGEPLAAISAPRVEAQANGSHVDEPQARPQLPPGDAAAYIIYTSGSTGRPKGIVVTRRGIANRLLWMATALALNSSDRILVKTSPAFDVSLWELFAPLTCGATGVCLAPGGIPDPQRVISTIDREAITTVHFVPSLIGPLYPIKALTRRRSVKHVIFSGETLTPSLPDTLCATTSTNVYNFYGPTETTIDVTWWKCRRGSRRRVPIGWPIDGTTIHLLNDALEPVPALTDGEIYVSGVGLARGYNHQPGLTAARFVANPWGAAGTRIYATGDIGRYRPDGVLEFIGRSDEQVKVRGVRIETAHLAHVISRCAGVKEAAAVVTDRRRDAVLTAFVVPSRPLSATHLTRWLRQRVPHSMIPARVVFVDSLPRGPSGKVDVSRLRRSLADAYGEGPETSDSLQRTVHKVWARALGRNSFGMDDSFFDVGGHSFLAIRIISTINRAFKVELPFSTLLGGSPTVASVSDELRAALERGDRAGSKTRRENAIP